MSESMILIDAFSQIYRGFFAVSSSLANSSGQPTNAVYALAKFLLRMEKEFPCRNGAFVTDRGKATFRLEVAPDYKANRPPMPDEMKSQMPFIERLIGAFGWPLIGLEGYEADDLLAAICADNPDTDITVFSSDKDLAQLVNDQITMLVPGHKSNAPLQRRGVTEVIDKFQVPPEKIVDYLALIGDSSDNIPGIPGVGPKTAAKLLNECSGIASMLANPQLISNESLRKKITDNAELLKKNIFLVTLKKDVPEAPWRKDTSLLNKKKPDWQEIAAICEELELKSIMREIESFPGRAEQSNAQQSDNGEKFTPDLF